MKKIGILGGIAWPSTAEYYAGICRLAEESYSALQGTGVPPTPEIVIESLDFAAAVSMLGDEGDSTWGAFDAYHRAGLRRLERNGATFAVIASNTAHLRYAAITQGINIPILNIVEVAATECARSEVTRLLVLGTTPVMRSLTFRRTFSRYGIEVINLSKVHCRIISDTIQTLQCGTLGGAANLIDAVITESGLRGLNGTTAVYLGCTELSLAFPAYKLMGDFEVDGVRYINSTALHIRSAFQYAWSK